MAKNVATPNSSPLEEPYESFDLLYPMRQEDRKKLKDMLIGRYPVNPVPYSVLDYLLSPRVGKATPVCKTVVEEKRYYDKDHVMAYSTFYSRSFRDIKRECTRLHFFSRRLSAIDLADLRDQQDFYLGFCVIRPLPLRKIGRTVLTRQRGDPALEFPTCNGNWDVNIGGSGLTVKGPAFMEQDTMVAACASTALWMSTSNLAHRFGQRECSTAEITEIANQYLCHSRAMPSEGLLCEQMIHALRSMEYDPLFIEASDQEETKHLIYSYIESEIPPILLCRLATGGNHAIVGIGHGYQLPIKKPLKMKIQWENEAPLFFARSSQWIPYLLVNDDQRGLYRKLTFIEKDAVLLKDRIKKAHPDVDISSIDFNEWHCPVVIDMKMPSAGYDGGEQVANIAGIIVPLPRGVLLTSEQAELKAALLIRYLHWLIRQLPPNDLVLRTYLIPSNEYKERIEDSEMDVFVRRLYRGKPMPQWIWVTEISSINSYNMREASKWLIRGEVLIDATSNPLTPDFIALHYVTPDMGRVATMKPEHEEPEQALETVWFSQKDKGYPGWVR